MRIVHLRSASFIGGPERQIVGLLSRSKRYEHAVASFVPEGKKNPFLDFARESGLNTLPLEIKSSFDPACIIRLLKYLNENKVKVICSHDYRANFIGAIIRYMLGVKQIAFFRGWTGENRKVAWYEGFDRLVLRGMDAVVAVSESKVREMQTLGIVIKKTFVIPNSMDMNRLDETKGRDIRSEYGIGQKAKVIGSVGRLSAEKGHSILLRAFSEICKEKKDALCLLVGDGAEGENLKRLARGLGIENRVIFTGWQNNALAFMKGMDIFVLPSLTEGLPNVLLEAAALGKPIIATAVGGCGDIIEDGKTGILVKSGCSASISKAIRSLFTAPCLGEKYSQAAKKLVIDRFGFEKAIQSYEKMLEHLL